MSLFIPEWTRVASALSKARQAFSALDDEHIVRKPLKPCPAATFFVHHKAKGWLAVVLFEKQFDVIDPTQMFDGEERHLWNSCVRSAGVVEWSEHGLQHKGRLPVLAVLWACSTDQVRLLAKGMDRQTAFMMVSREQYLHLGPQLFNGLMEPIDQVMQQALMASYFPEAEIQVQCAARRPQPRDHNARLTKIFLDHHQEWASKWDLELPNEQSGVATDQSVRLVNGVAGSGKTLIAVNRALMLSRMNKDDKVLLIIFNTPIVADLNARIDKAFGGKPENLQVETFFSWVAKQWWSKHREWPNAAERAEVLKRVENNQLSRHSVLKQKMDYLLDELDYINESMLADLPSYKAASRTGRGIALREKEREIIWEIFEATTGALAQQGKRLWSALPSQLCLATDKSGAGLQKYQHILVDEAQFFAPSWFELVKRSRTSTGHLFLCADPNQGFMKSRLSWRQVGLDVTGRRTKRLNKSYRTTKAILRSAQGVLEAFQISTSEDHVQPDYSEMTEGTKPIVVPNDSVRDAQQRLINELAAAASQGISLDSILVIFGDGIDRFSLYSSLERRFGYETVWWFNDKHQKKKPPGQLHNEHLRMTSIDTATGLEGALVFLIGVDGLFSDTPLPGEGDEEFEQRKETNARKLYMAMTRAGHELVLMSSQKLPQAMQDLFSERQS